MFNNKNWKLIIQSVFLYYYSFLQINKWDLLLPWALLYASYRPVHYLSPTNPSLINCPIKISGKLSLAPSNWKCQAIRRERKVINLEIFSETVLRECWTYFVRWGMTWRTSRRLKLIRRESKSGSVTRDFMKSRVLSLSRQTSGLMIRSNFLSLMRSKKIRRSRLLIRLARRKEIIWGFMRWRSSETQAE